MAHTTTIHPLQTNFVLQSTCIYLNNAEISALACTSKLFKQAILYSSQLNSTQLDSYIADLPNICFPILQRLILHVSSLHPRLLECVPHIYPNLSEVYLSPQRASINPHKPSEAEKEKLHASLRMLSSAKRLRTLILSDFGSKYFLATALSSTLLGLSEQGVQLRAIVLYQLAEVHDGTIGHLHRLLGLRDVTLDSLPLISNKSVQHLTQCLDLDTLTIKNCRQIGDLSPLAKTSKLRTITLKFSEASPLAPVRASSALMMLSRHPDLRTITLHAPSAGSRSLRYHVTIKQRGFSVEGPDPQGFFVYRRPENLSAPYPLPQT